MENINAKLAELNKALDAANADHEVAFQHYKNVAEGVKEKFESILLKYLPADMVIRFSQLDPNWGGRWVWQWRCEVVRSDFDHHSDFYFYYSETMGVQLNNGCIGNYGKEDSGYIAAIKTMARIWDHIDELEGALRNIDLAELSEAKEARFNTSDKKNAIETEIRKIHEEEFKEKLFTVGTTIELQVRERDRLFDTSIYVNPNHEENIRGCCKATVVKVTPKKVLFDIVYGSLSLYKQTDSRYIKKEKVISAVKSGSWKIVEE